MRSSLVVTLIVSGSFLLGFLRDVLIAREFGSSWLTDALFVALVLPVFFENLFGLALRDAMIPYLQRLKEHAPHMLKTARRRIQGGAVGAGVIVSLSICIGAPIWLHLLAPGWSAEQVEQGSAAFRVGAVLIAVQTALYSQAALLNIEGRFVLPMWRPVLLNIGGIVGFLVWPQNVEAMLWGMLGAQILLIIVQRIALNDNHPIPPLPSVNPLESRFLSNFAPVLLATAAQQACVLAERFFGSLLEPGSITQLSFAFRIATIPLTIFTLSILVVLYPAFSAAWVRNDRSAFTELLRKSLGMTFLLLTPAAVALISRPGPIISVLLERGQFGPDQTAATADLLAIYAVGLPGMGLALLGGRTLLAQGRAVAFMSLSIGAALLTIGLDVLLYPSWGARGLAMAYVAGNWLQACIAALLIARMAPESIDYVPMLRWIFAAGVAMWVVANLPVSGGLVDLTVLYVLIIVIHLLLVGLLGERAIFKSSFWARRASVAEGRDS